MNIFGGVALAVAMAMAAPVLAADTPAFVCAPASAKGGAALPALSLADRFATREVTRATAASVCRGESPSDARLAGYATRTRARKARRVGATIDLVTKLGAETLTVKALDEVRIPAAEGDVDPGGVALACYAVRHQRAPRARVVFDGGTGEVTYDVARATRVCVPTAGGDAATLVCHALRPARTKGVRDAKERRTTVKLAHAYGGGTFRVGAPRELCMQVVAEAPPPPPPDPAFTLDVTPHTRSTIAGTKVGFVATAHFPDGHDEDRSATVVWSSSDESVTRASSVDAAFFDAVGPGTATIAATDPATGIGSADGSGNASLTVTWPLEKLTIAPHDVVRTVGGHEGYTVIGWFTGGTTRNLTQRVTYASSNPLVAEATNTPGNRSRVNAIHPGTTTITATDPISGITTTDSGNDASMRVIGSLSYILVTSNQKYASRFPGQSQHFTARGYDAAGGSLNLTQRCVWSSDDPAVAVATNPVGDRSRIDAVAPGLTTIRCTDAVTGIQSYGEAFWTLGDLVGIEVDGTGAPADWLATGEDLRLTAIGKYTGGGQRNVTQEVTWVSRDPEIAIATNAPDDRSRIVAVGPGNARVFATDVGAGIASADASVFVLGALVSVSLRDWQPRDLVIGSYRYIPVSGNFTSLSRLLRPDEYRVESSDPTVIEVVNDGHRLHAIAGGTADIVARHLATGITSAPETFRVKGNLASITLTPATATRGIGEWESFTAIGNYPPDFTEQLTQSLTYASSDESVAVADNALGMRSRVRTVGAGTATITATDPVSGIFATSTITVLPGTIERVTIEPATGIVRNPNNSFSYTAIGHYPDGSTINVTQIVTWSSLDPTVAHATNEAGNRSRIVAQAPGTATITALHPSGVGSHDTGDDAAFVTRPLVSLKLTPEVQRGHVGGHERYTLVGTFDDATTINLTQDAYYWTDTWSLARALNPEGDRSLVEFLAPGTTTVHAQFADWDYWYPLTSGSVTGAFLVVDP